jgi:hypothetical protein
MVKLIRSIIFVVAGLSLLAGAVLPALAQEGQPEIKVFEPNLNAFPAISFALEVSDGRGGYLTDLTKTDFTVLEDETSIALDRLERSEPGLQFVVSINAAPILANRVAGVSHFNALRQSLVDWAETRPATGPDRLTLTTSEGVLSAAEDYTIDWIEALQNYQPNLVLSQASQISFSQALDRLLDPGIDPNMRRVILYITPLPTGTLQGAIPGLTERARQANARVFVWMVGPTSHANFPGAEPLRQMAEQTGGEFFLYSGVEEIPNVEAYLNPLRYRYLASYTSRVNQSGEHQLRVVLDQDGQQLASTVQSINIKVQAPNPIFLSPPTQIQRGWPQAELEGQAERLEPKIYPIRFLVEFPDGYPRELVYSRLYVNGELAVELTEEPFSQFDWPLEGITESGTYALQIEARDSLGLSRRSISLPVTVNVQPAPRDVLFEMFTNWRFLLQLAAVLVPLAGLLLLLRRTRRKRAETHQRRGWREDPLTQPVVIPQEKPRKLASSAAQTTIPTNQVGMARPDGGAQAYLLRLTEEGHALQGEVIELSRIETTFGSDPNLAVFRLDDPSVSGLHARIYQSSAGKYIVADAGSVAGTWVNYAPVSSTGVQLQHGDLLNFGRASFRFELRSPQKVPKAVVLPYNEE